MAELSSRQEYLKRYLDDPKKSKSKKKRKKIENSHKQSRFKIVDQDIDMKKIEVTFKDDDESDEAPLVVNVIDDRPEDVKVNEMYSCKLWKKVDGHVKVKTEKLSESEEERNSNGNFSLPNEIVIKTRPDSDDDLSPPRGSAVKISSGVLQKSPRSKNSSTVRHDSDSDMSPPRAKTINTSDSDLSPPRSKGNDHHHKHENLSPPRRRKDYHHHHRKKDSSYSRSKTADKYHEQKNFSPARTKAKDQNNKSREFSPPRRKMDDRHHKRKDFSLSKSKRDYQHHEQRDLSPPRRNEKNSSEDSSEKNRNQMQHSSDSDFSPPRKKTSVVNERCNLDSSAQHKKIRTHHPESDKASRPSSSLDRQYSKRTRKRHDSGSDTGSDRDQGQNSTKRENVSYLHHIDSQSQNKPGASADSDVKKHPVTTLSGMKAGLQDSASLQEETCNLKYRERMALEKLDDELSGRNAETISRDKDTGRKRNLKEERLKQKEKEKKNAEKLEKYYEWGKGLKQRDDQQKRLQEDMYEMSKPLARYVNDDDLERSLKDVLKDGDPMLEYMRKKRNKTQPTVTSSLPSYEGPPPPPNRFNIPPGYRWDGVDRSNGFEKRFFEKINNTKATEHQAYLWSIENM